MAQNLRVVATLLALTAVSVGQTPPAPALVVHEWGTFTCLQDDDGDAIGGVNTEDEPLPAFVHRPLANLQPTGGVLPPRFFKGLRGRRGDVTMRLETPVVYFHVPAGAAPLDVDVDVAWHGGWLTEFYPLGEATFPGAHGDGDGAITSDAVGTLSWRGVHIGEPQTAPSTDAAVWLAPRHVDASDVRVGNEAERYLFYRGVGNADAPLRVRRSGESLAITSQITPTLRRAGALSTGPLWLLDVDPDRGVAFRELPPLPLTADCTAVLGEVPAGFDAAAYAPDNLDRLRASMHRALVAAGLFADEAQALLTTWDASYFKSDGTRLFFVVPQAWTDQVMPLRLSVPASIVRVMVARIELVNDRQRELLAQIAAGPTSNSDWLMQLSGKLFAENEPVYQALWDNRVDARRVFADSGIAVPADYDAWIRLGRFRHGLLADELAQRSTPALVAFATAYDLN